MLDWELFGDWAGGGHLESAALHGLNALLLWWVLARMTGRRLVGWWAALLWAVHPLRVESVAWASERKDVLATLFGLAAVVMYLGGRGAAKRRTDEPKSGDEREGTGAWRMWGVAGWLATSLLCKPTMVTLPCVLLLLDGWPSGRWKREKAWRLVAEKWPLWLVAAASCAGTLIAQRGAMASVSAVGVGERVATALTGYGWYLEKWAWPSGLACFYPRDWAGVTWGEAACWGMALAAASAGAAWAWQQKGWGWVGVGWFWFLGTLVPMIGLVQVGGQVWADRYSYWPHMGLWLVAACGAAEWAGDRAWRRRLAVLSGVAVAVTLAVASRIQTGTWKDNEHLFGRALAVTTGNAPAEGNLGTALAKEGRWAEARGHLESAVALNPADGILWYQLGTVRWHQCERGGALEAWKRAVREDETQWEAMNNLAWVALEEGRVAEARQWIDRAMANEKARENAGVLDTEERVRRAEERAVWSEE